MNTDFSFFYFCDSLLILRNDHLSRGNIVTIVQNFSRNHPERLYPIIPTCRIHFAPSYILQRTAVNHIPLEIPMATKLSYNALYRSERDAKITVAIPTSGKTQGALTGRVAISSGDFELCSRFYHRIQTKLASAPGQATADAGYYVSYYSVRTRLLIAHSDAELPSRV